MVRSRNPLRAGIVVAIILVSVMPALAQEPAQPQTTFFDVQLSKDEIYSYKNLKFTGDYFSFESAAGSLALGTTEAGVTILILLGPGSVTITTPDEFQDKFKTAFSAHPLTTSFKTIYMRLNPKEYAETIGKQELAKSADESVLTRAKDIYDQKFLASYHAGPRAMLPNYKTRRAEFETEAHGWIVHDEGYWITLFRVSPYARIYPANTINPKQK